MRKNSFGQGLVIFFVIIGILYVIGSIDEASEPKCIKAGCDNKQARNVMILRRQSVSSRSVASSISSLT